jgi:hypothetical protein
VKKRSTWKRASRTVLAAALGTSLLQPMAAMANPEAIAVEVTQEAAVSGDMQAMPAKPVPVSIETNSTKEASVKVSKDEAVAKMRELFPILKDATVQNVELGDSHSYPPPPGDVWTIHWEYRSGNGSHGFSSRIDATTGDVLSMYAYFPGADNEPFYPAKLSRAEALEQAKAIIPKAAPSIDVKQLEENTQWSKRPRSLFGPVEYPFAFELKINGVKSTASMVNITLTGSGQVREFHYNKLNAEFPSPVPAVSSTDALAKLKKQLGLKLAYIPVRKGGPEVKEWYLGWLPAKPDGLTLDAQTGEFIDSTGNPLQAASLVEHDVPKLEGAYTPVQADGELTKEQAVEQVLKVQPLLESLKLHSSSLQDYFRPNQKVWRLHWSDNGAPMSPDGSWAAVVDAASGQLLELRKERFYPPIPKKEETVEAEPSITEEEATEKAMALVNKLYPNASENLKWTRTPQPGMKFEDQAFHYSFIRYHNGIAVNGDTIGLALDGKGELTSYYVHKTEGLETAASIKPVISEAEALKLYEAQLSAELTYRNVTTSLDPYTPPTPKVLLVYSPKLKDHPEALGVSIDAVTGKFRKTYDMWPDAVVQDVQAEAADIEGHRSQKQLKALVEYGILKPDSKGNVNPDQKVSVGEWMTMMVVALTPYFDQMYQGNPKNDPLSESVKKSEHAPAIRWFLERRLLKTAEVSSLDPNAVMTREQFASYLTRLVGYEKLSVYLNDDALVKALSDKEKLKQPGAVAVALKLGLLEAENGSFVPAREVTRAQVAEVMLKLVELQGKVDQGIGQGAMNRYHY